MTIPYFLLWVMYIFLTLSLRGRYMIGKFRGYHCYESKDVSKILYGSVTEYSFDRNMQPTREYLTWGEFWRDRGYYKAKNKNKHKNTHHDRKIY